MLEHIWKLIGAAQTCESKTDLRLRMAEIHGRIPVQYTLYLDPKG